LDEKEKDEKIKECHSNVISLVRELVKIWNEIDSIPKPPKNEEGIKERQSIGSKLITLKNHLKTELEILDQVEEAPNIMDKCEGSKNNGFDTSNL
jgi:hypothetical protein